MKSLFLSLGILLLLPSVSYADSDIIKYKFETDITTDIYVRTGKGEGLCGGTVSISAFYWDFDEYIDAVIFGRGGYIAKTWVIDSNEDKNPEVFVHVENCGSGGYGDIYSYELMTYDDKNARRSRGEIKWVRREIPEPSAEYLENYRGRDAFDVLSDGLVRRFPQYHDNDSNASPSKGTLTLKYLFKEKKWTVIDTSD